MAKQLVAEASVHIQAHIEDVWRVMTDVEKYSEWNPFVINVKANGVADNIGTTMYFTVQWHTGGKQTSTEVVTEVLPPYTDAHGVRRAYWCYVFHSPLDKLGMVHAIRHQWLEQHEDGRTSYRTQEISTGWAIMFLPFSKVQNGFERQAAALKHRVEALARF